MARRGVNFSNIISEKCLDLKSKGISSTLTCEKVDRLKIVIAVKRMVY
jgi:hypothetical protein